MPRTAPRDRVRAFVISASGRSPHREPGIEAADRQSAQDASTRQHASGGGRRARRLPGGAAVAPTQHALRDGAAVVGASAAAAGRPCVSAAASLAPAGQSAAGCAGCRPGLPPAANSPPEAWCARPARRGGQRRSIVPGYARRRDARGQPGAERQRHGRRHLDRVGHVCQRIERAIVVERHCRRRGGRSRSVRRRLGSIRRRRPPSAPRNPRPAARPRAAPSPRRPAVPTVRPGPRRAGSSGARAREGARDARHAADDPPDPARDASDAASDAAQTAADPRKNASASSASIASTTNGLRRCASATAAGPP